MQQLSMIDLMIPPPPRKVYEPPPRSDFMTRAYGSEYIMKIGMDEPDPFEIEVRCIPTLIRFGSGWSTYTVRPAGTTFWSDTGFRSFGGAQTEPDEISAIIDRFLNSKDGKLTKWWPSYCLQWRQNKAFGDKFPRATTWDQWGPEKQAEHWANFDAKQASALAQMAAEGIDYNEVWRTRK